MLNYRNYLGREVIKQKTITEQGTFASVSEAEKQLREMGYTIGSMSGNQPIGFACGDKYNYISKWYNMTSEEHGKLDGVMISDDWREGSVEIIWFKEPKEDLGPEYDGAGFTIDDREEDPEQSHHCDDLSCNCSI